MRAKLTELVGRNKETLFVNHIEHHLKEMKIDGKVHCKICNMNIDEMIEERVNEFIEGFGIKKD